MLEVLKSISVFDYFRIILEIAILSFFIYAFLKAVVETKARQLIFVFIVLALLYLFSYILSLKSITVLITKLFIPILMVLVVFYAQDLKKAFSNPAKKGIFRQNQVTTRNQLDTVLNACKFLSTLDKARGALIVFPRSADLRNLTEPATKLNADLSENLLITIFQHDNPLHDGAIVIQGGKITHAAVFLPLTNQINLSESFGTRHRAAIGVSEEYDCATIIVSEETRAISLAINGEIYYDEDISSIAEILLKYLNGKDFSSFDIKKILEAKEEEDETK